MDIQLKSDIEFLLSFAPCDDPEEVPEGLNPMFYFTNTYDGDVKLAQRIRDIKDRYLNNDNSDNDK